MAKTLGLKQPVLSVVVAVYNMRREAARTLYTLTSDYQKVSSDLYEVIVVDNGSSEPLGEATVRSIDPRFQYHFVEPGHPSPAAAINAAVRRSQGQAVGVLIDGARMLTPGVLRYSLQALRIHRRPLISTLGAHLGHLPQQQSVAQGYSQKQEDRLLASIDWKADGYRLFDIGCLAASSKYGVLAPLAESNALFMPRQLFEELDGLEERFSSPGGGLVNLDFYKRAQQLPDVQLVTLLGEASFHQVHGGATTRPGDNWSELVAEYEAIRGCPYVFFPLPWLRSDYLGQLREPCIPWLGRAIEQRKSLLSEFGPDPYEGSPEPVALSCSRGQQVVAVLGMHRSGTSLLAGTLQEAGLVLGDVVTDAPHNRKGNRESLPIRALHDDLLQRAGGSWDNPPAVVTWELVHRALQVALIERFTEEPCWGFKDPRSLFCLEGWFEALPQLQCVAIVRHPEEVARSLLARDGLPLGQGLRIWQLYNMRLLHWLDQLNCPLLHFGADPQAFLNQAEQLIASLGLPRKLKAQQLRFHDQQLRHQQQQGITLPPEITNLYQALMARSLQA